MTGHLTAAAHLSVPCHCCCSESNRAVETSPDDCPHSVEMMSSSSDSNSTQEEVIESFTPLLRAYEHGDVSETTMVSVLISSLSFSGMSRLSSALIRGVNKPVAPSFLASLSVHASASEDFCVVCSRTILIGNSIMELPCGHSFHDICLRPWLIGNHTCPVCRSELFTEDADYFRSLGDFEKANAAELTALELRRSDLSAALRFLENRSEQSPPMAPRVPEPGNFSFFPSFFANPLPTHGPSLRRPARQRIPDNFESIRVGNRKV